jgi:hypothetical protein
MSTDLGRSHVATAEAREQSMRNPQPESPKHSATPHIEEDSTYVVRLKLNELIISMHALVIYHSKKIDYLAKLNTEKDSDEKLKEDVNRCANIAEALILHLQDAIDEKDLSLLAATQDGCNQVDLPRGGGGGD